MGIISRMIAFGFTVMACIATFNNDWRGASMLWNMVACILWFILLVEGLYKKD